MRTTAGFTVVEGQRAPGALRDLSVDSRLEHTWWSDAAMPTISKWIKASRNELVFDVAERSLKARLSAVLHYLPLAAKQAEEDVEHVHQLRVWTRRATAALRLYRDLIPWSRAGRVKKDLSRLRRAANDARDDDVLMIRLQSDAADPGAARLLTRVRARREAAQQPLLDIFDQLDHGERFESRVGKLLKRVRQKSKTNKLHSETFGRWARKNVRSYIGQFLHDARADMNDLNALHRLRISGKKLRYTMELLAGAFPARFAKRLYPKVEALQDRLGEINDLATALRRYRRWLDNADDPAEIDYLRRLLASEQGRLDRCRQEFLSAWTSDHVRRFAKAFDQVVAAPNRRGGFSETVS